MMVGYFTKYGDGGVDLEPLGELYKHEVRGLARALGVPEPLVTRPPTAGLWPGQTDEGELGITYDELDAILLAMARGEPSPASPETTSDAADGTSSAHKRAAPPVSRMRERDGAEGYDGGGTPRLTACRRRAWRRIRWARPMCALPTCWR